MTSPLEVLAINESKLDGSINDGEIHIPGYVIIRKDRNRHGGGVALYIKESLSYSNRADLVPDSLEMICVEINLPHNRSFLVSTWYRPPSADIDLFGDYDKFIEKCDYENKQLIIMGDMNSDYAKSPLEAHTRTLQFLSSIYQLEQLILEPTRVTKSSATIIDLIFTNETKNIAKSGVVHIGISDHSLTYVVRKFIPPKSKPITKEVRNFKRFVEEDFINDLKGVPWHNIESFNEPNLAWRAWKSEFNAILDRHAPLRHRRVRQSSLPWLTSEIRKIMHDRDYHKKIAVKHGSQHHWELYQAARNKVNIEMRKAKSNYYRKKIEDCKKTDPKTTWKLINSLTGKVNKPAHVNEIRVGDKIISDDKGISEAFNDFFINIGPKLAAQSTKQSSNKVATYLNSSSDIPPFRFSNIPVENVLLTLKQLKVSKSTGLDKIPAKILKIASDIIAPSMTFIFNLSLSTGIFIDEWKNARVNPIYKNDDRRDMGNYRPISILPIISKVFEKEVFRQLYAYLNENCLLSKFQSGFRPYHSTVSALIQMCDVFFDNMDNGKLSGVIFLDIRKAFDSIDHNILFEKLKSYGVSEMELTWFQSYLTARHQQCFANGFLSTQSQIICGIPQGSILGPLLFLIYINDLPNCLSSTTPCLYADDTQIFTSSYDALEITNSLNSDLENISDWLTVNKLQSHPSKTKLMVIGSAHNLNTKAGAIPGTITINNDIVSHVNSQKCLGVEIDERLSFDIHIEKTCKKVCSGIGALRRIKPFVPLYSLEALYKSLIQPYFDYCSPLWDTCGKLLKDKLQRLQNRAARVITGAKYDIRSVDVLDGLHWDTLQTRRAKVKGILMYKILNEQSAPYLRDNVIKLKDTNKKYNLRNLETNLALPKPKTNFLKRSFKYDGAMLWNNLPNEAKMATSLYQFKRNVASLPFAETC